MKKILITQQRVGTLGSELIAMQFAARELGWDVLTAPSGWRLDEEFTKQGLKGVPYGSQTFCEVIAQQMNWTLKTYPFDWLVKLPEHYLKRKVDFMTLGEAKLLTETKFIKPADDKVFNAKVYAPGELITHEAVPLDTPTLVSDIVEWDLEYRCFSNGKKVLTWSNYIFYDRQVDPRYWNMVPIDDSMNRIMPIDVVNDVLNYLKYHTDVEEVPAVIDVGRIPGKGWAIIETNQAWASGLYGCDPLDALKAIEHSVE